MTSPKDDFANHCVELLGGSEGGVRAKRMFGGHGLYIEDLFVAIVVQQRLYLKVDDESRARFEAARCVPFVYDAKGKQLTMSYCSAPDEAMESPAAMQPWARLAVEAALRARTAKAAIKPRAPAKRSAAAPAAKRGARRGA
jgi:DNA transformation protein